VSSHMTIELSGKEMIGASRLDIFLALGRLHRKRSSGHATAH
jgi:hypothetical protein